MRARPRPGVGWGRVGGCGWGFCRRQVASQRQGLVSCSVGVHLAGRTFTNQCHENLSGYALPSSHPYAAETANPAGRHLSFAEICPDNRSQL